MRYGAYHSLRRRFTLYLLTTLSDIPRGEARRSPLGGLTTSEHDCEEAFESEVRALSHTPERTPTGTLRSLSVHSIL